MADRLEEIAASRSTDPDIRWLLDEVLRLRARVDEEHAIALLLSRVCVSKLNGVATELAAVIGLLTGESGISDDAP